MDGLIEAKGEVAALLERVRRGETLTITQGGRPVARLVATPRISDEEIQADLQALRALRDGIEARSGKVTWEELKADRDLGRR